MEMDVFDREMRDLIAPDAEMVKIAGGFRFTEGPVWNQSDGSLYFSDIPGDTIHRFSPEGGVEVFRKPSHYANGLAFDRDGCLVACEHRTRRVTRTSPTGIQVLADSYRGKRLNSPNDVIVAKDGSVLFTDPCYGLREGLGGPGERELTFQGVYRIAPGSSEITLLVDDFETPNGLALTPDERHLYIIDSIPKHIRRFEVHEGWRLSGGDVLVELSGDGEGKPDGMKLDGEGRIFSTGPGGVWICSSDGDILGRIRVPEKTSNLAWGECGEGYGTLFITASTSVYSVRCRLNHVTTNGGR